MLKETKQSRRSFLGLAGKTIAAVQFGMLGCTTQQSAIVKLPIEGEFPSLIGAITWFNSQPLTAENLRGKVVLVSFWTYTCINWLRQLPYVRAWAEKYKDQGLVVIGVHTPEFEFEKNLDNVRRASTEMKVNYPIAADSDYKIWRAFKNQYWPALYFIDTEGRIRHHQFGEGEYEESEKIIQQLLNESKTIRTDQGIVSVNSVGVEAAADWENLRSPENYTGYGRTENFVSSDDLVPGQKHNYRVARNLSLNQWSLNGDWTIKQQFALLNNANGKVAYSFQARDLHIVMGTEVRDSNVRFRVTLDGNPPLDAHGIDVDEQGNGRITGQRLYQIIRQSKPVVARLFEIEFLDAGAEVFAFTFG